jgi:hypothetical protein
VGSSSSGILLRLKAILASDEPEVLGACYSGILRLEGASVIPWVSRFLRSADDPAAEAALAIAGTHSLQGFEVLRERFTEETDPWFRSVLLSAIALTRQDAALEFLLDQVRSNRCKPKRPSKPSSAPCHRPKLQRDLKRWSRATGD